MAATEWNPRGYARPQSPAGGRRSRCTASRRRTRCCCSYFCWFGCIGCCGSAPYWASASPVASVGVLASTPYHVLVTELMKYAQRSYSSLGASPLTAVGSLLCWVVGCAVVRRKIKPNVGRRYDYGRGNPVLIDQDSPLLRPLCLAGCASPGRTSQGW